MSVIYRDRDRERFDDSRTSVSTRRDGDRGYTTVKRYVVKGEDSDSRSSFGGNRSRYEGRPEGRVERVEETRIVRREVDTEEAPRRVERREEPRFSERELAVRSDRDFHRRDDRSAERELVIRRETTREEPRDRELTVSRVEDRRESFRDDRFDYTVANRDYGDRDLQKYTRTSEYFSPQPQPQVIVIKNEPIIIRERARDDDFDVVRRSEVDERSVVKREPSRDRRGEEEFFYEKKVRERIDSPPRREHDDDFYERREMRREISPHDSVSQAGRHRDRDDYSDDSMVYVRKEKITEDEGYDGSRSPKHRRHLAEGVIAGIGAAELLRHHKKKEGGETSGGIGRIARDVGAGVVGAVAAEGISRARSRHRSRSRARDRSDSGSRRSGRSRSRGRGRSGSRSRSESPSKVKKLATLGLGAAAIAAAAAIASKKMKDKSPEGGRGRSSSRRRASSVGAPLADDARNPKHRNKRMAEAGAAGAVIAGLIERQRSKSRGGRDRSHSKIRQSLPIVAAGLGSAAIAGLYEKNKAKKETEAAEQAERRARSRSRSRSRSRGRNSATDPYYDGPRAAAMSDPGLIEYGDGNVYGNNYGADYYGQPPPGENYYNNGQNAVVPAAVGGAAYGAAREARSRSLSSQSSSDGGRQRRRHRKHRSRSRSAGREAAAAVGGAAAAGEYERRKQEKRERKARKRQAAQYGQDPYDQYNPQRQQSYTPTPPIGQVANDPYASQTGFYPQGTAYPQQPASTVPQYAPEHQTASYAQGTSYTPHDFPPPPGAAPPPQFNTYGSGGNADPYAPRGRGADENVSATPAFGNPFSDRSPYDQNQSAPDGLSSFRGMPQPPPMINVHRPSDSTASIQRQSNPFIPTPNPFSPPPPNFPASASTITASAPRSVSQPPGQRKSVQFAAAPVDLTSEASNQDLRRQHRRGESSRGYEAGEDTDSPDDQRRKQDSARSQTPFVPAANGNQPAQRPSDIDLNAGKKRRHHRRRSAEPTASSSTAPGLDPNASANTFRPRFTSESQAPPRGATASPASSDATVDLPDRFDKYGRKKPEAGDDPTADRLDNFLGGKVTGKLFGNLVDGLFGPEGRPRGGSKGKGKT